MYYQNYEDYMRSILGYPTESNYTYDRYVPEERNSQELEQMYPEIYRSINPLVCRECDNYNGPITQEAVENIVDRIYSNVIINNEIMIKINIDNRSSEEANSKQVENRSRIEKTQTSISKAQSSNSIKSTDERLKNENLRSAEAENRQIRRPNIPLLRDLIRILVLNRLLNRLFPRRPRTAFQDTGISPMRPQFPGVHGTIAPMPRDYEDYLKF